MRGTQRFVRALTGAPVIARVDFSRRQNPTLPLRENRRMISASDRIELHTGYLVHAG
jgi:hypothetical protein